MGDPLSQPLSRQMVLDLTGKPGFAIEDFLVSPCNIATYDLLDLWPNWSFSTLLIVGPPGSGKSHLGTIWASKAKARIIRATDPIGRAEVLDGQPILMEDCDRRLGAEAEIFHFLNEMKETGAAVVMTGRLPPDRWNIRTPDLLSRLRQSPLTALKQADEPLIRAILVKLFNDRQIRVDEDVVNFATIHIERSFEAVELFVKAVDDAALSSARRITKVLAAAVIAGLPRTNPD